MSNEGIPKLPQQISRCSKPLSEDLRYNRTRSAATKFDALHMGVTHLALISRLSHLNGTRTNMPLTFKARQVFYMSVPLRDSLTVVWASVSALWAMRK